jgi:hypothetical protein
MMILQKEQPRGVLFTLTLPYPVEEEGNQEKGGAPFDIAMLTLSYKTGTIFNLEAENLRDN